MKDCAPEGKQARCVGFASVPPPIWYSGAGCDSDAHGEERIATWGKRIVSYAMQCNNLELERLEKLSCPGRANRGLSVQDGGRCKEWWPERNYIELFAELQTLAQRNAVTLLLGLRKTEKKKTRPRCCRSRDRMCLCLCLCLTESTCC